VVKALLSNHRRILGITCLPAPTPRELLTVDVIHHRDLPMHYLMKAPISIREAMAFVAVTAFPIFAASCRQQKPLNAMRGTLHYRQILVRLSMDQDLDLTCTAETSAQFKRKPGLLRIQLTVSHSRSNRIFEAWKTV
jgi:hypothetical protein